MSDEVEEDDGDETELVIVNMQIEFYLRHRDDPLQCYMQVGCPKKVFEVHGIVAGIWHLMDEATNELVGDMNSKSDPYLFITDKRMNRYILRADEIQSVSVLTPDKETVKKAMEESEADDE